MIRTRRLVTVSLLALATALPAFPASAKAGDVVRTGSCSGNTNWKIKASPENGRIEVESEIDSNKAGQSWSWRLLHNGSTSAQGSATTQAPSGSFTVRRLVLNLSGPDSLKFRAVNPRSGELCIARVTL
jgi:uncharacterized membrane protein